MSKFDTFFDTVNDIVSYGASKGILKLYTENESLSDSLLKIGGKTVVDFGSCSYLGLQFDRRLKDASIQAIEQYGSQLSCSRVYVSSRHYLELESNLEEIFGYPTLVAQTTTLAHMAAIPVLFKDDDAVILDHQVHNSVQNAVNLLKFRKVHVEMIRHNRMDLLEDMVKNLRQKFKRIWYMADGIYSMYGDESPVDEVYELMDRYPELHFYVDDAHGMSGYGKNGRGRVLDGRPLHPKCILATSFAKAFPTGGAALVFPERWMLDKVRNSGAPFLSSGPLQPAQLGAAIACSKIHLTDEIYTLQNELQEKLAYTNQQLKEYQLPLVAENKSPIFFVGVSLPKMGNNMIRRLMDEGFYTNLGVFPTVPMKNTGVRFTVTRLNTYEQIRGLAQAMAHHYPLALAEEGLSMDKVYRAFKMEKPKEDKWVRNDVKKEVSGLKVAKPASVNSINKLEWDACFEGRGAFDWKALRLYESAFSRNEGPGQNWDFDYLVVRDNKKEIVLATFFTTALSKDDMLSSVEVSVEIEKRRKSDPEYMTSRLTTVGSLITEGNHLYINENHPQKKEAMEVFFDTLASVQEKRKSTLVQVRDLTGDLESDHLFADQGYFRFAMPENYILENMDWSDPEAYVESLSKKSRRNLRSEVIRHASGFETRRAEVITGDQVRHWYDLYLQVKRRSLEINTFDLPYRLFELIAMHHEWDVLEVFPKGAEKPAAFVFCHKAATVYSPVVIGLDYALNQERSVYRQTLYQIVLRAHALGKKTVRFGFTAGTEKKKLGAQSWKPVAYMNATDNFKMEALGALTTMRT